MKKVLILLFILLLSTSSISTLNAQDDQTGGNATGYIPIEDFNTSALEHHTQESEYPLLMAANNLPASYSLVAEGKSTSVKDQNPYGTCWAHALIASAESNAIVKGYADSSIDLSELQLAYFAYNSQGIADPLNLITNDYTHLGNNGLDAGGDTVIASITAASGIGLAEESLLPYSSATNVNNRTLIPSNALCYASNSYYVSEAHWLNTSETDIMKERLIANGAIAIAYYHDNNYLAADRVSYYCNSNCTPSHAVTIVGWDDNYSRYNFKDTPLYDGAWLIKNSWGEDFGDDGYFWMSYCDQSIDECAIQIEVIPTDSDDRLYQYDGTGTSMRFIQNENNPRISYKMANVYTATRYETLKRVGFVTGKANLNYTINIYKNLLRLNNPSSGTLMLTQSGTAEDGGYNTVELNQRIDLDPLDDFSIVITLTDPTNEGFDVYIDMTSNNYPYFQHQNSCSYNQSFLYSNGSWGDTYSSGYTYRIKGYTESSVYVDFDQDKFIVEKNQSATNNYTINKTGFTVTFESSNPDVAIVNSTTGLVTGIDYGRATITATIAETCTPFSYEVLVPRHIDSISAVPSTRIMHVDETYNINVTHLPEVVDDELTYTYSSSTPTVATVSDSGVVTAVSLGTTVITITSVNNKTTTLTVTVKTDPVSLDAPNLTIERTAKTQITASWSEIEEAGYYILETSLSDDFNTVRDRYTVYDTSKTMNITFANSKLYYRVKSCFKRTNEISSQWSSVGSVDILPAPVTGAYLKDPVHIEISCNVENQYYDGYEIWQSSCQDGTYSKLATITDISQVSYIVLASKNGDYYYKTRAYIVSNKRKYYSGYSNICYIHYELENPIVTSIAWDEIGCVNIFWDANSANSFNIYRSTNKTTGYKRIGRTNSYEYQDKTVEYGKTYYYKVSANYLVDNVSYESTPTEVYTKTTTLKKATITSLDISNLNGVEITWNDNNELYGNRYKIYRATSKSGTYKLLKTTSSPSERTYLDTTAVYGKTYYYKVRAFNNYQGTNYYADYSSIKSVKYKLATPVIDSITIDQLGTMNISWSPVGDATLYRLQYSTSKSSGYKTITTTSSTSYTQNGLTYGKTYYYRILAINNSTATQYTSSYSSIKYKKMSLATPTITSISSYDVINCHLEWNEVNYADCYDVYYSTYSNKNFKKIGENILDTQLDIPNLTYGKTYYFKVIAKTTYQGNTCKSSYSKVSSKKFTLPRPSSFTITSDNGSLTFDIAQVNDADGYEIYRCSTKTGTYKKVAEFESNTGEYFITSTKTYYYKIRAYVIIKDKRYYSAFTSYKSGKAR